MGPDSPGIPLGFWAPSLARTPRKHRFAWAAGCFVQTDPIWKNAFSNPLWAALGADAPQLASSASSSSGRRARRWCRACCRCKTPLACPPNGWGWKTSATCLKTRPTWPRSRPRPFFSLLVAVSGIAISLVLAVLADRIVRGALVYKTLLIWPYAVAPAVAGVLWLFMFARRWAWWPICCASGLRLEPPAQRQPRHDADRDGGGVEADLLQLPVLPGGLQSIPKSLIEAAAIDGAGPWRGSGASSFSAAVAHHVLPAGDQRGLCLLRHLRHRRRHHQGGPGKTPPSWSTRCIRRLQGAWTWAARPRSRWC
jgi:hypothetical protein